MKLVCHALANCSYLPQPAFRHPLNHEIMYKGKTVECYFGVLPQKSGIMKIIHAQKKKAKKLLIQI